MSLFARAAMLLLAILFLSACKSTETVLTVSYEGQGKITQGTKIDCGNTCQATYPVSTIEGVVYGMYNVKLLATPATGYDFFGWEDCGRASMCNVTVEPDCAEYNVGPNFVTCKRYATTYVSKKAIFVPKGSVVDSAWEGWSSCLVTTSDELKCWNHGVEAAGLPSVDNPRAVEIGYKSGCVLDDSGLQCWGEAALNMPTLNAPGDFVVEADFTCAIDGGQVTCWPHERPADAIVNNVPELSNPVAIWVNPNARSLVCAEDDDGTHCWGRANVGQLTPPALDNPSRIEAFGNTTCALTADGIRCWGESYDVAALNAQLNNATDISRPSSLGMCGVDAGGARCIGKDHQSMTMAAEFQQAQKVDVSKSSMCTTQADGIVCGNLYYNPVTSFAPPVKANGQLVAVGGPGGCAMTLADRRVSCWGGYDESWLSGNTNIAVSISNPKVLSVMPENRMWCAGGDGGLFCRRDAQGLDFYVSSFSVPTGLVGVTDIDMTDNVACAAHSNGVTCWGVDSWGHQDVPALSHPAQVAVGTMHACALDDSGVVCWGLKPPRPQE